MGNSLPRVSRQSLPCPSLELKETLSTRGLVFQMPKDWEGKEIFKENEMVNVAIPDDIGLYVERDRGDITNSYLVDLKTGETFVYVSWMSKGSYDNYCSLSEVKKKMNMNAVKVENGYIYALIDDSLKEFIENANQYHEAQYRGASQIELNSLFEELSEMKKDGYPEVNHLLTEKDPLAGMVTAVSINFAKPYSLPSTNVWEQDD